ncbi:unnamed protein product [Thlaspi arvense]|uniref:Uncharacterized protein n=1 Tax=Thlaspi arvense TaxID=13288 RepID=A0AAU9SSZ8_THLAR|nr:unnamed protein product [Thlaspi arvense]
MKLCNHSLFWDAENTTVEPKKMERLLHNIEGSLKRVDLRYNIAELKFVFCNKGQYFDKKKVAYLKENHFIKIDVPYCYRRFQYPGCKTVLQWHDDTDPFQRAYVVGDRLLVQQIMKQSRADPRYHVAELKFVVCNKGHDFVKKNGAYLKENHFIKIDVPYHYRKCQYTGCKTVFQWHDGKDPF